MAQLAEITPELISSSGLAQAELQELLEIFQLVDLDHGGTISTEELGTLMQTMGIRSSKVETETMLNEIDAGGGGEIDFPSFVRAMSRKVQTKITEQELQWAFRQWSNDGNIISLDTMKRMLTQYGDAEKRLTNDEADDLLLSFPELKRGTFDWEKFLKSIL